MIQIIDKLGTLSEQSRNSLESTPVAFNVKITYSGANKARLDAQTRECVTSPSTLCVSINPRDRFSAVYYGTDVAPTGSADVIKKAGNPSFRQGNWEQGVKDIILRAQTVSATARQNTTSPVVIQQPIQTVEHPMPYWPFAIGFVAFGVLGLAVWRSIRKQQTQTQKSLENQQAETAELAARNIREEAARETRERIERAEQNEKRRLHQKRIANADKPVPQNLPPRTEAAQRVQAALETRPSPVVVQATPPPIVVVEQRDDLLTGALIGEALASREPQVVFERTHFHRRQRREDDTPPPTIEAVDNTPVRKIDTSGGISDLTEDAEVDESEDGGSSGFDD